VRAARARGWVWRLGGRGVWPALGVPSVRQLRQRGTSHAIGHTMQQHMPITRHTRNGTRACVREHANPAAMIISTFRAYQGRAYSHWKHRCAVGAARGSSAVCVHVPPPSARVL
jgi:hypothetical protein